MVLFNKIKFSVEYLEKSLSLAKHLDSDLSFNKFFIKINYPFNLFGQTLIFQAPLTRGKKGLFGYGSSLKKTSLFAIKNERQVFFYYKYFRIFNTKKRKKQDKREGIIMNLFSSYYKQLILPINTKISVEEKEGKEYTLDNKMTPYLYFKEKIDKGKSNYKILEKDLVHDFYTDDEDDDYTEDKYYYESSSEENEFNDDLSNVNDSNKYDSDEDLSDVDELNENEAEDDIEDFEEEDFIEDQNFNKNNKDEVLELDSDLDLDSDQQDKQDEE